MVDILTLQVTKKCYRSVCCESEIFLSLLLLQVLKVASVILNYFLFAGAPHGSELIALFGDALMLQIARRPMSQKEKEVSSKFKKYIKNFVAFGSVYYFISVN